MNKENTFRALQDQEPIVERWQCRVGFHRWLKWSDLSMKGGDLYAYQKRACADCNKIEIAKQRAPY